MKENARLCDYCIDNHIAGDLYTCVHYFNMPRFSIQPEGEKPIRCDSADQAVQYFANALHHGRSGAWKVHAHVPRFAVHPTRRRGPDELYLSGCGRFALRKRVADAPQPWTVLGWVDGEWQAVCRGNSREECEAAIAKMADAV
jgi:hypothetical protein